MKRLDALFFVSLSFLAYFVGREVIDLRHRADDLERHTASNGAARVSNHGIEEGNAEAAAVADERRLAVADEAEVARRRLELSAEGTYIGEVLAARDSSLARWPDRRTNPLRVWVQPSPRLSEFNPDYPPLVREAFVDWTETGIPMSFTFVLDSALSDIKVMWLDRFNEAISGKTLWAHDSKGWIVDAQIQLALHHRSGEPLDHVAIRAIALHEVGHLLGLDHASDTTTIMNSRVRVRNLSTRDRATVKLLYALPPGRLVETLAASTR